MEEKTQSFMMGYRQKNFELKISHGSAEAET